MKISAVFITMALVACFVTSHVAASDADVQWFHHPYLHPHPHPGRGWPFHGALPPMPHHATPFKPDPQVAKCFSHAEEIHACLSEITSSFFAHKASIGPQCCKAISAIDEDCEKTIFGCFHNPFFNAFIKQHCSNQDAPSAPTPA